MSRLLKKNRHLSIYQEATPVFRWKHIPLDIRKQPLYIDITEQYLINSNQSKLLKIKTEGLHYEMSTLRCTS